jgi:hypothetical protein
LPHEPDSEHSATHPKILSVGIGKNMVFPWLIEGEDPFHVGASGGEVPLLE